MVVSKFALRGKAGSAERCSIRSSFDEREHVPARRLTLLFRRQARTRKIGLSNVDRYGINNIQDYQFPSDPVGEYNLSENYYDLRERRVIKDITPKSRKTHASTDNEEQPIRSVCQNKAIRPFLSTSSRYSDGESESESTTNEEKYALNHRKCIIPLSSSSTKVSSRDGARTSSGWCSYLGYPIWISTLILVSLVSYAIYLNFSFLSRLHSVKKMLAYSLESLFVNFYLGRWIFLIFCISACFLFFSHFFNAAPSLNGPVPFTDDIAANKSESSGIDEVVDRAPPGDHSFKATAAHGTTTMANLNDHLAQLESRFLSTSQGLSDRLSAFSGQMDALTQAVEEFKRSDSRRSPDAHELDGAAERAAINEATDHALDEVVNKAVGEVVNRAVGEVVDKAVGQVTDDAMHKFTDNVINKVVGRVTDEASHRVADRIVSESIGETTRAVDNQLKTHFNQVNSISEALERTQNTFRELEKKFVTVQKVNELIRESLKVQKPAFSDQEWLKTFETILGKPAIQKQLADSITNLDILSSVIKQELSHFNGSSLSDNILGTEPDYALANIGGHVIVPLTGPPPDAHWPPISPKKRVWNWFSGKASFNTNHPSAALSPSLNPGDCWAFPGSRANFTVTLACPITPTGFTIDHVVEFIAPQPFSAPKGMRIYALTHENNVLRRTYLHEFTYDLHKGVPSQTFHLPSSLSEVYEMYQLEILSNWGHSYTCLYRLRVHGKPTEKCQDVY